MATPCTLLSQRLLLQPTHTSGPQAPPARSARADLLAPKAMAATLSLMDGFLQEAVVSTQQALGGRGGYVSRQSIVLHTLFSTRLLHGTDQA